MRKTSKKSSSYNGEMVAGSLLIPESREVAKLLIQEASAEEWHQAITIDNILQKRSPASAKRQAKLIRNRLALMPPEHWALVKDGNPNLLKWYEHRGFILLEPDGECLDGAIKKISQKI